MWKVIFLMASFWVNCDMKEVHTMLSEELVDCRAQSTVVNETVAGALGDQQWCEMPKKA